MRRTQAFIILALLSMLSTLNVQADEHNFEELQKAIEGELHNKSLPALSITLVDEKGVVWSKGFGNSTNSEDFKVDGDTIYRIGSVSKLFTDMAIMQYVEKGILDLDEPVSTYLKDFAPNNPFGKSITLRMLTSHSSGLVRESPIGHYFDPTEPSLADTVKSLNETTLVYAPDSKVQYSNAGIAVVGRVLEVISGQPFATLLKNNLLLPLGMKQSAFEPEKALIAKLPKAYMWSYHSDRTLAPTFELGISPAGSMYSSMNDLAYFMAALIKKGEGLKGRILKEETLDQMWTPQGNIHSARNHSYGIGFALGDLDGDFSVSHGGAIYGFATQMKVLPDKKVGVAISTNLDMANGTVNRIADYALRTLLVHKTKQAVPKYPLSQAVAKDVASALKGRYVSGDDTIEVITKSGDLYIDRVKSLSIRLQQQQDKIVIDDIHIYSEDIAFSDNKVRVLGQTFDRVKESKPVPLKKAWSSLIGEYGYDHNVLYISEKFGRIHALIEWGVEYPLIELGQNKFKFPAYGLYPNEVLEFEINEAGKVYNASLNGVNFKRRSIGDIEGGVFHITPVKPIAELEAEAKRATAPLEKGTFKEADLVDITKYGSNIKLDVRYATNDNFLGVPIYSSARAFLQRPAAVALSRITKRLEKLGYGLLVHDAYRPWYVSKIFWDATPQESKIFVADPSKGSRHNRGSAIDLTLYDLKTGDPIEMVGLYDEMTERSFPYYPGGTSLQRWHRELLRDVMESEGFKVYEYEWWHFDFDGWQNYRILTSTFEEIDGSDKK